MLRHPLALSVIKTMVARGCLSDPCYDPAKDQQGTGSLPLVMARVLEQMPLEPLPVIGAEAARAQVDHRLGSLPVRSASSASIALSRARIGTDTGEPGIDRARLT